MTTLEYDKAIKKKKLLGESTLAGEGPLGSGATETKFNKAPGVYGTVDGLSLGDIAAAEDMEEKRKRDRELEDDKNSWNMGGDHFGLFKKYGGAPPGAYLSEDEKFYLEQLEKEKKEQLLKNYEAQKIAMTVPQYGSNVGDPATHSMGVWHYPVPKLTTPSKLG